jgi:hypothetical protein
MAILSALRREGRVFAPLYPFFFVYAAIGAARLFSLLLYKKRNL